MSWKLLGAVQVHDDPTTPGVASEAARAAIHSGMEGLDLASSARDSQGSGTCGAANDAKEGDVRMKKLTRTYLLIEVEHSKDIPEMTDLFANRISTHSHVEAVTATLLDSKTAFWMAVAQKDGV